MADLLLQEFAVLHTRSGAVVVLGLPGRGTQIFDTIWIFEHLGDFFKGLASGFGKEEVDMYEHCHAKHAEDDLEFGQYLFWHQVGVENKRT